MGATFHGRYGHQSAGAMDRYEIPEQAAMGLGDKAEYRRGDGKDLGHATHAEVVRLGRGQSRNGVQLRRTHRRQKEGEGFTFTLPYTVTAAMKHRGLLDTPQAAFGCLDKSAIRAMREMNRFAYGRTTEHKAGGRGRRSKLVKVDLYYLVYRGFRTRAGEVSPQVTVYVLNMGRAADGKFYALDWPALYRAQRDVKAVWHMGVAHELGRKGGIVSVPHRYAFRAAGIDPKVKPGRSRQIRERLQQTGHRGHRARARAARDTRPPKPKVTWAEAVKNFAYRVKGAVERKVAKLSRERQRRFARASVRAAVTYCRDNSLRFTARDVKDAAAHVALTRVHPAVFVRAFKKEMAEIERLGITRVATGRDGQAVYTGSVQALAERRAAARLAADQGRTHGKLTARQVAKALAAKGYSARELAKVSKLAAGGVTVDEGGLAKDAKTMRGLTEAYRRNGKAVHFVGRSGRKGEHTPQAFASALTRTSHLVSLWRGLRSPGPLVDKLAVAEQIRRNGHQRLKRGSLVVADVRLTDAVALRQIADRARTAKAHLLLVGEGSREIAARMAELQEHLKRGQRR